MPAARTLRGITKVISFVAAIDILFEIAADTAHTGKLRFPGIIFPNKHTNRFSMIPGFVKIPACKHWRMTSELIPRFCK